MFILSCVLCTAPPLVSFESFHLWFSSILRTTQPFTGYTDFAAVTGPEKRSQIFLTGFIQHTPTFQQTASNQLGHISHCWSGSAHQRCDLYKLKAAFIAVSCRNTCHHFAMGLCYLISPPKSNDSPSCQICLINVKCSASARSQHDGAIEAVAVQPQCKPNI